MNIKASNTRRIQHGVDHVSQQRTDWTAGFFSEDSREWWEGHGIWSQTDLGLSTVSAKYQPTTESYQPPGSAVLTDECDWCWDTEKINANCDQYTAGIQYGNELFGKHWPIIKTQVKVHFYKS